MVLFPDPPPLCTGFIRLPDGRGPAQLFLTGGVFLVVSRLVHGPTLRAPSTVHGMGYAGKSLEHFQGPPLPRVHPLAVGAVCQ